MDPIKIKATGQVQPVELEIPSTNGTEAPTVMQLEIREMAAIDREKHLDATRARMSFDAQGKPIAVIRFEGMQPELLARCLFRAGKLVPLADIQKWPASAVEALFSAAQSLNGLDKDSSEKAVKESKNA